MIDRTVLVVDGDSDARHYLEVAVLSLGLGAAGAPDGETALSLLATNRAISLVLLDLDMPPGGGLETLRQVRNAGYHQPAIIVSRSAGTGNVVRAIKAGATDFVFKPVRRDELALAIRNACPAESSVCATGDWMVKGMHSAWRQVAASELPLLIEGETGAGKEALARRIHAFSPRAEKPFVKVNCAVAAGELGGFAPAHGGTLFLDEIGEMDVPAQAKLARFLEDKECERAVRVMAATRCDLRKAVEAGQFRADLYYRINVVHIRVPALRERKADIPSAAKFFLRKHTAGGSGAALLSTALREAMLEYQWPGNMRELENLMRQLAVIQDPDEIARQLVFASGHRAPVVMTPTEGALAGGVIRFQTAGAPSSAGFPSLEKVNEAKRRAETDAIMRALDASRWNRRQAARILRIDYKALLYKMRKLEIDHSADTLPAAVG